jgi:hypothetical protein
MMRTGVTPVWRLRHANKAKAEVVMRLTPRLLSDDMIVFAKGKTLSAHVIELTFRSRHRRRG